MSVIVTGSESTSVNYIASRLAETLDWQTKDVPRAPGTNDIDDGKLLDEVALKAIVIAAVLSPLDKLPKGDYELIHVIHDTGLARTMEDVDKYIDSLQPSSTVNYKPDTRDEVVADLAEFLNVEVMDDAADADIV